MRVCARTDFCGNDFERFAEYATKLGVKDVWSFPEIGDHYDQWGRMDPGKLKSYKKQFEAKELRLALITETLDDQAVASRKNADRRADALCRTLEAMADADLNTLFLLLGMHAHEDMAAQRNSWNHLVHIYRNIIPKAEDLGISVANHGHQFPEYLIYGYSGIKRLLDSVPSDFNGATLCLGCHQLAGDDIPRVIRSLGRKIFFVHARNVARGGFEDTAFHKGQVDVIRALRQLKDAGYEGLVCPEHLPLMTYEPHDEIGSAWGLGYLVAALSMLDSK